MVQVESYPLRFKSSESLRKLNAGYEERGKRVKEDGRKVAWCSGVAPIPILGVWDFYLAFAMSYSAVCGFRKVSLDLCEVAESRGYSPDLCSYTRTNIGAILADSEMKIPRLPPKPDIVFVANNQCHTITKWYECIAKIYDVPFVLIDIPTLYDNISGDEIVSARRYVKDQLQEVIDFLETFTGNRFDYDKLQESCQNYKRTADLWKDVVNTRRNIPSPMSSFDIFNHTGPMITTIGTRELMNYYEELKAELADRVANKIGSVPNERIRLHIDSVFPWIRTRELYSEFAKYGANVISETYYALIRTFELVDASNPLESLAESLIQSYLNIGLKQRADVLMTIARDYSIDGMILQVTRGCKALNVHPFEISRILEKAGLPTVLVETDQCDSRVYSDDQVNTKIEAFIERLEAVKAKK